MMEKMAIADVNTNSQSMTALSGAGTATEHAVAKVWAEVLRSPTVEADANFFDIGGDSMKAMEVIARISQDLGIELPLMSFFEDPTIKHLAEVVDELTPQRSASEEALSRIWLEVLRLPSVETTANFFDIGGDSMKAMEVIAQVNDVLNVELLLMSFFEDPTIAHLANVVNELIAEATPTAPTIARVPGRTSFPLSYSQQVFWLLEQQNNNSGLYNTARVFYLHGYVDAAILERALNEVRNRHEIFQVRFVLGHDGPMQIVDPGPPLQLDFIDVSPLAQLDRDRAAQQATLAAVRDPLDLEAGPPLRARLIRTAADESILAIAIHHVVSDGYTGSILLDELSSLYDAFAEGRPSPLPPVEVHFTDFAAFERETLTSARIEEDLDYWRPALEGAPTSVDLPADHDNPSATDREGHLRSVTLPAASLQKLQALAQANSTTLFTVLNAAFRALLYRFSGQSDFLIGTISSNRSRARTERMVGCFVNSLPLRNPIEEGENVRELISREKNAVMNAFAHQDCPFAKIVEAANPERSGSDNPLFNVALLYQSYPAIGVQGRHWSADDANFDAEIGLIDLRFIAFETKAGLQLDCEFRSAVFEIATIDKLLSAYTDVLMQIAATPEMAVAEITLPDDLANRAAAHRRARHRQTILIAANFTADPVAEPLAFWMDELRIPSQIELAPFDQVYQQLLDPTSLVARNTDGFNILAIQWREGHAPGAQARELAAALKSAAARGGAPIIVCICPPESSAEEQLLADQLSGQTGVHVVYPHEIHSLYPVENYRDEYAEALGAIPYTSDFFVALASIVARRIYGLRSTPYKVIALDCDNTLWRGVCGEEGPLGVEVDAPRRALQEFMLAQREAGMLLCLNSKNVEADVAAVFATNPGMLLKPEHIIASRINWQSKSENLHDLARQLNLGVDSIIFVDDNPLECAEVRANCPGALVLELPADATKIPDALHHLWAFDHWSVTHEDRQRTELYRQEQQREQARTATGTLDDFLRSLELVIDIRPMQPDDLARIAQLTQRTNQFNTTTIRRSETEIAALLETGSECLIVNVRDRFGDYGLVGVTIFSTQPDALAVDTLLMSCRALGRKVEHNILAHLGRIAQSRGLAHLDIHFAPTAKNRPALDFLESLEATPSSSVYSFTAAQAIAAPDLQAATIETTQQPTPTPTKQAPRADLARIATDLSDVKSIARAIRLVTRNTSVETGAIKPRTAVEEIVGDIWALLLHIPPPGIHDDFFRLGGNSLLAVQVISRVRQALGVEMPLRAMFEEPTLAGFAQRIEVTRRIQTGTITPPLVKAPRTDSAPASFAQQRLWFLDQLEPDNPIYNIPQMTHLRGPLNVDALQRALTEIVRRHEALRTTFVATDGQPLQIINPEKQIPLPVTDLTHLPSEEREIQRLALEEAVRPFNLATGPVFRAQLLRSSPEDHILLIVLHHIIGDRWSAGILAEEMEALYAAFVLGQPSPLPDPTIQYADFSIWQRSWLQGAALDKQAAYWKRQLAGAPALLEFPTDYPRPAVLSHKGATNTALLSKDLVDKLTALSQTEGVTLFMTMLAALQTLMSRYSGQDDIVVGSPIAGRNTTEVEHLIGFFVNTLALRTDLSGNPTFRDLLSRVKQSTLDAYAHQDIPFEKLVEELQPERSLSYQPIFQVLFALQNAPQRSLELAGLHLQRLPLHQGTSTFDMSWFATSVAAGMELRVEYNTDLFDAATIQRAMQHFETLLHGIIAHPEQHIAEISLLSPTERHHLLVDFNDSAAEYPRVCIHDLVAQQVARRPHATALIDGATHLTYAELNARANQLAHLLISQGAGPDIPIGIFTERTAELVIGILGILKSGSPYAPIDPEYPSERIAYILEDAAPPVVLTQSSLRHKLPPFEGRIVCLDEDRETIASQPTTDPVTAVQSHHLAYILFTSGSTGRPKGVALEHRTPVTFIQWAHTIFSAQDLSGVLFSTSVCFDVSMFEMFVTLAAGGKVIVAANALDLPTLPARDEVTLINVVPSVMTELVRAGNFPTLVSTVNLAGEALSDALVEQIYTHTAARKVFNLYGPTETSYATFTPVLRGHAVTIGKPLFNTQCYILDSQRNPSPIGIPGELFIAGDGVARGYHRRPELTAERFLPNPFGNESNPRMYRTGDNCRWLPNGNIQYLGRMDHQVKLRGFRIELGEIEATLEKHPAVAQSVALVREDEAGTKRLVAYAVRRESTEVTSDELRAHARQTLPDYMVPSAVVVLDAMPLTPNGKINRSALPAPEFTRDDTAEFVTPHTPTQVAIASIWMAVLKLDRISATDSFFSLGGHSLLATQVISRIRQTTGVELPLRTLFEFPTISQLALKVDEKSGTKEQSASTIPLAPRNTPLPLSFAQQRMWFSDQLDPGNAQFNIPCASRVDSAIDIEILTRTINALVERHETLRTNFAATDGLPAQIIHPTRPIPIEVKDLRHLPTDEREAQAQALVNAAARTPFDLARDPLLRALVIQLADDASILFLSIHHIISDRWSITILLNELSLLYGAFSLGKPSPLPSLPVQYADFAAWQRSSAEGELFERQLAYWTGQLKDAPPVIELPTDRPRPAFMSVSGETAKIALSPELTAKLHALSLANGATLYMTLLAGFEVLLARYSGLEDFVIGMPIASRSQTEIEGLIGLFANTLPLRTNLSGDPSFKEVLVRTKDIALKAYANQDIPLERLVEELRPERSLSYDPLVQVHFILQNAPLEGQSLQGLNLDHIETDTKTAKGDLFFSLAERNGALRGRLEYNTDLYDAATIERMLNHYRQLLESAVVDPAMPVSQLRMLSPAESQKIMVDWNATYQDYARDLCLHQLIEQQAARTPDAIACVFADDHLTYRQLNQRANQVAHTLIGRGINVGDRVGIFVERSLDLMVGLLGIQKSGAAYVPLDPSYPAERVAVALEEAEIALLLTHEPLLDALPKSNAQAICLDRDWPMIAAHSVENPRTTVASGNLIYVMFTSGSTGRPKGVQVPHGAVVNLMHFMARELRMGPRDVFPALASFAFDMCIPELYLALATGGRVLLCDRHMASNGEELASLLNTHDATIVHATPTTWSLLLQAGYTGKGRKRAIGAEPLSRELCTRLLEADNSLYNFYGPTETTVWSAFHHFTSPSEPVVVGRPLDNTQIYILDKYLQPVPVGVPGEIHIAGDGVTCGYLNRPALTAEKFVPDINPERPGALMYKTGDLGRFLTDGRIEFQGRVDNQVKIRGYRVELGEIETVLGSHHSVRECIVVAREDVPGDKRLVAYAVPVDGAHIIPLELRQWVRQRLPDYMVPAAWVQMTRLPLSANGKVDRKALPKPDNLALEPDSTFIAPTTLNQEMLASIIGDVLRIEDVGLHDNFFELGGHSLSATQVVSRVRQTFQVDLRVRTLFESPTVAALSQTIELLLRDKTGIIAPPIVKAPRDQPLPLSFAQQRLWVQDLMEPNNPMFNVPRALRLKGSLNIPALEAALNGIIARHEILRTTYASDRDGHAFQIIAPELKLPLPVIDLRDIPSASRESELRRTAQREVLTPFNLAKDAVTRNLLLQVDDDDHLLIMNTHHIASDGWSRGILVRELIALYEAALHGRPSPLPELPIQYADFGVWQRNWLESGVLDQQLQYWKARLDGAPPLLAIPTDRPRPATPDYRGATHQFLLPPDLADAVHTIARQRGATSFMVMLAAFQCMVLHFTGNPDVILGTDLANRTTQQTEDLVGFFVNLLVLRTSLAGDPTFDELLGRAREVALEAYAHQDVPFDKLVEEVQPERNRSYHPLVQVLFVQQNTPRNTSVMPGIQISPYVLDVPSKFDMAVFVSESDEGVTGYWLYNPDLFEANTIVRMAALFQLILETVTATPTAKLSSLLQTLEDADQQQRLAQQREFKEISLQKLKSFKRRPVTIE